MESERRTTTKLPQYDPPSARSSEILTFPTILLSLHFYFAEGFLAHPSYPRRWHHHDAKLHGSGLTMEGKRRMGGVNEAAGDGRRSFDLMPRGAEIRAGRLRDEREQRCDEAHFAHSLLPLGECRRYACSSEADRTLIRTTESLQERS